MFQSLHAVLLSIGVPMKFASLCVTCLFALLVLSGCGGGASPPESSESASNETAPSETTAPTETDPLADIDLSSPEATFASFKEAMKTEDWKTGAHCLTEDSQAALTGAMVF